MKIPSIRPSIIKVYPPEPWTLSFFKLGIFLTFEESEVDFGKSGNYFRKFLDAEAQMLLLHEA